MPDSNIDRLNIEITSSTEKAQQAISGLTHNLRMLAQALNTTGSINGLNNVATSAATAEKEEANLGKTARRVKKEVSGMMTPKVDSAKATRALTGMGKRIKAIPRLDMTPIVRSGELEKVKRQISKAVNIPEATRADMLRRANASLLQWNNPVTGETGQYTGEGASRESILSRGKIRAQMLEEELNEKIEIANATEQQAISEEKAAEAARKSAEAYKEAYAQMKAAIGATGYSVGGGMYRHGDNLYSVSDFLGKTPTPVSESTVSELDNETQSAEQTSNALNNLSSETSEAKKQTDGLGDSLGRVNAGAAIASKALFVFRALGSALVTEMKLLANAIMHVSFGVIRAELNGVARATLKFSGAIAQLAGGLVSLPFRPLIKAISNVRSGMGGVTRSVGRTSHAFRDGLRFIIRYVFGFRSLFYLMRYLRQATKDAFGNLAQVSENTNANLSLLSSRLSQLKNSLASAFDPILTAVTPILDFLIQKVIAAFNAIGQFFAAITGQSTWQKATFQMKDFAASAKDSAASSGAAKDAAEDLKKSLMGFDKINKLDDADSSSGGSGGGGGAGGGGADYSGMFTTETVNTGIANFAQMIKDAWGSGGDFSAIGTILGQRLKEGIDNINWESIQTTATKIGTSLATLLNGFVTVDGLSFSFGKTIGEAINTGLSGWGGFVNNLKFDEIGTFIAKAINAVRVTVDWELLAKNIATTANGLFAGAKAWSTTLKFGKIGEAFSTAIFGALSLIEWDDAKIASLNIGEGIAKALNKVITVKNFSTLGTHVAEAINTVIEGAYGLVSTIKWGKWGNSIAASVNEFFKTFDFAKAGLTLSTLGVGILTAAKNAVQKIEWATVAEKIKEGLKAIQWGELIKSAASLTGSVAGALGTLVSSLFSELPSVVSTVLNYQWIKQHVIDPFTEGFKRVTDKTPIQFVIDAIAKLGSWIFGETFDPKISGLVAILGGFTLAAGIPMVLRGITGLIASVAPMAGVVLVIAGVVAMVGSLVVEKTKAVIPVVVEFVKGTWETVVGWVTSLPENIGKVVSVGVELAKEGWTSIKEWILDIPKNAKDFAATAVGIGVSLVKQGWETVNDWVKSALEGGVVDIPVRTRTREDVEAETHAIDTLYEIWGKEANQFEIDVLVNTARTNEWTDFLNEYEALKNKEVKVKADGEQTQEFITAKTAYQEFDDSNAVKKVFAVQSPEFQKVLFSYSKWKDDKVTKTADGKATPSYRETEESYTAVTDDWITKYAQGETTTSFYDARGNFLSWLDDEVTKTMTAEEADSYTKCVDKFMEWTDDYAKKIMQAGKDPTYEDLKKAWDEWKDGEAKKILSSKFGDKNKWNNNKTEYNGVTDDDATKTIVGEIDNTFYNARSAINGVEDNEVELTPVGRSTRSFEAVLEALIAAAARSYETSAEAIRPVPRSGYHYAIGGAYFGGLWHNIAQYASGGAPNYGTIFVAGEAGPEAVGRINGRTEVLNQSQMASVMYDAVVHGMMDALSMSDNKTEVHLHLEGDAKSMFRAVRKEANAYTNATGRPAFNL